MRKIIKRIREFRNKRRPGRSTVSKEERRKIKALIETKEKRYKTRARRRKHTTKAKKKEDKESYKIKKGVRDALERRR